jgi:hypothetical protein
VYALFRQVVFQLVSGSEQYAFDLALRKPEPRRDIAGAVEEKVFSNENVALDFDLSALKLADTPSDFFFFDARAVSLVGENGF